MLYKVIAHNVHAFELAILKRDLRLSTMSEIHTQLTAKIILKGDLTR